MERKKKSIPAKKKIFQEVQIALFLPKEKVLTFRGMVSFDCNVIKACYESGKNRLDQDVRPSTILENEE